MRNVRQLLEKHSKELHDSLEDVDEYHKQVIDVAVHLKSVFDRGCKVLIAGNGGSASQAQHFSDEMVGRYKRDRQPYPVIALTADSAVLTCIGNDYGYEHVFSRQVEALGKEGDVFVGLTTSGTSKNILKAAQTAHKQSITVVAFTGPKGTFGNIADYAIIAPSETGARIQEFHLHAIHLMCELFEKPVLFERSIRKKRELSRVMS